MGEEIRIDLVFRSSSPESIVVAPFPPTIQINQADTGTVVLSFAPGGGSAEIPASGTLIHPLVWNQRDEDGELVKPGRYSVIVNDVTIQKGTEPREARAGFGLVTEVIIQSP